MAIEILKTPVMHDARHDLESIFWLLLWVALRYAATTCYPPDEPYATIFGAQTDSFSAILKSGFLIMDMEWEVKNNKPLTTLTRKYKQICYMAMQRPLEPRSRVVPLTYEAVLALFDGSLADPNWPQDDHASPISMPTDTVVSTNEGSRRARKSPSLGSEKRRMVPGDEDPLSLPPHKRAHIYRRPVRDLKGAGGVRQAPNDSSH